MHTLLLLPGDMPREGGRAQTHAGALAGKSFCIAAEKEEARQLTASHLEILMSHDPVKLDKRKRFLERVYTSASPRGYRSYLRFAPTANAAINIITALMTAARETISIVAEVAAALV